MLSDSLPQALQQFVSAAHMLDRGNVVGRALGLRFIMRLHKSGAAGSTAAYSRDYSIPSTALP